MAPPESDSTTTDETTTTQVLVPTSLHGPVWEIGRRVFIVLVIAFGVWLLMVAAGRDDASLEKGTGNPRVAMQIPLPDGQAQRQTQVGVELVEGYTGVLAINGTPIPEDQLDGARDPASMSPEELKKYGVRPNNRNRLIFTPGPGKVFEAIPLGEVTVTVNYYRDRQVGAEGGTYTWSFEVQ
jgi:hypothetical protein